MAFKIIPKKKRKAAIIECINGIDVKYIKQVANKYDIDYRTLHSDCYDIVDELDAMLKKKSLVQRVKNTLIMKMKIIFQK